MLECSTRVTDVIVSQLEHAHLDTHRLGEGLELSSPLGFVDWENYATLLSRAADAVGGAERLGELCAATFNAVLPEGAYLMNLAGDWASGMELINAFADASFFSNVRYGIRRTGARTLRVSAKFGGECDREDVRIFSLAVSGNLRAATAFAGLPYCTARTSIGARASEFELTLPSVEPAEADGLERRTRRAFLRNCRQKLVAARRTLLEARRTAQLAAVSATYTTLSAVTAEALASQHGELMPGAAVRAIAQALRCQRVAITRRSHGSEQRQTLAELGAPAVRARSVEVETPNGLLVVEASVGRGSREEAALRRLGPWLGLVFATRQPPSMARPVDWQKIRLAELAERWRLTPRQRQVALLMALGDSNKGIGAKLGCAEGTVELHARAIMLKAALPSRAALAAYFFAGG